MGIARRIAARIRCFFWLHDWSAWRTSKLRAYNRVWFVRDRVCARCTEKETQVRRDGKWQPTILP